MRFLGLFWNSYRADFSSMDSAKHNDQLGRLWIWAMHEDDNLMSGVSLFLLAQFILGADPLVYCRSLRYRYICLSLRPTRLRS